MLNSFLFIIPLTPVNLLTKDRKFLRDLCFKNLKEQKYSNWKALLVGSNHQLQLDAEHFLQIDFEGAKEEKLQIASKYYIDNNLKFNYLIRLDDDDIFNPNLLKRLAAEKFDVYTDKYHAFINSSNGNVSQLIKYWFPNSCIIKSNHAFCEFGDYPIGEYKRFKSKPLLIENEHNNFNKYFNPTHKVIFGKKNAPVYLRVLNPNSITSKNNISYSNYINQFGVWRKNNFKDFAFLKAGLKEGAPLPPVKQSLMVKFTFFKQNLISAIRYHKLVIRKNKNSNKNHGL